MDKQFDILDEQTKYQLNHFNNLLEDISQIFTLNNQLNYYKNLASQPVIFLEVLEKIDRLNSPEVVKCKNKILKILDIEFLYDGWMPMTFWYKLSQHEQLNEIVNLEKEEAFNEIFFNELLEFIKHSLNNDFLQDIIERILNEDHDPAIVYCLNSLESYLKQDPNIKEDTNILSKKGRIKFDGLRNFFNERCKKTNDSKEKSLLKHLINIYAKENSNDMIDEIKSRHIASHEFQYYYEKLQKKDPKGKRYLALVLFFILHYYEPR
ncbi:MAG: hypothetical protein ACOC1O_06005 [bacterium]